VSHVWPEGQSASASHWLRGAQLPGAVERDASDGLDDSPPSDGAPAVPAADALLDGAAPFPAGSSKAEPQPNALANRNIDADAITLVMATS
jgi:hypothetical protein